LKISKIILYDEPSVKAIKINKLKNFLEETFPVKVEVRNSIFCNLKKDFGFQIASCRIFNLKKPFEKHIPTEEEIFCEEKNFTGASLSKNIVMYDGFELLHCLTKLIPTYDQKVNNFHVIFTDKLTCTFDYNDYRYHGRALIGSNPTIISTTGVIEAPAKPKEYYFDLIRNYRKGINTDLIKQKYKGTYLEPNDPKLSKIIEGYLLQSIFYFETGESFCKDRHCRLFNAHWQSDLLHSQIEVNDFCKVHKEILNKFKSKKREE